MTQFDDLPDDCLIEVLDRLSPNQLLKMQRLNRRLKRLAAVKLETKTTAVDLNQPSLFVKCSHLDSPITRDQVLVLSPVLMDHSGHFYPSKQPLFLNIFSKCPGIRCVHSWLSLPGDVLLEMFCRCPQLECVKLSSTAVNMKVWDQVLGQIGHRIVHFIRENRFHSLSEHRLLTAIAENCPNIRRLDWYVDRSLSDGTTRFFVTALEKLPKSCRVNINCDVLFKPDFADVVDELVVRVLNWPALSGRVDRLSSLKLQSVYLRVVDRLSPVNRVEFVGLKRLDVSESGLDCDCLSFLIANRFPRLEEFCFDVKCNMTEDAYETLFQSVASVKKLIIKCNAYWLNYWSTSEPIPQLPRSSILNLKKLKTIELQMKYDFNKLHPKHLLQQLDNHNVEIILSLKKLIINMGYRINKFDEWEETVKDEVEQMKLKQNGRVEIDIICLRPDPYNCRDW